MFTLTYLSVERIERNEQNAVFFDIAAGAGRVLTVIADAAVAHQDEPVLENFDRYLGRELVKDNRAVNLDINRPLPLSCPPLPPQRQRR